MLRTSLGGGCTNVGVAIGTLLTNKRFGRLVIGTVLTWLGIGSGSIITGVAVTGGCCNGTVDAMEGQYEGFDTRCIDL